MKLTNLLKLLAPGLLCLGLSTHAIEPQLNLETGASSKLFERFYKGYSKIANKKEYTCNYFENTFKKVKFGKTGYLGIKPTKSDWRNFKMGWLEYQSNKCHKLTFAFRVNNCNKKTAKVSKAIDKCYRQSLPVIGAVDPNLPVPPAGLLDQIKGGVKLRQVKSDKTSAPSQPMPDDIKAPRLISAEERDRQTKAGRECYDKCMVERRNDDLCQNKCL